MAQGVWIVPRQLFEALLGVALLSGLVGEISERQLEVERRCWFCRERCLFPSQLGGNDYSAEAIAAQVRLQVFFNRGERLTVYLLDSHDRGRSTGDRTQERIKLRPVLLAQLKMCTRAQPSL